MQTAPHRAAPLAYCCRDRSAVAAAREGHTWIGRRIPLAGRDPHDRGADLYAVVEVDRVLVGKPDAARRDRRADIFGLVGAVDAEERVLAVGKEVERARTHRILWAAAHEIRDVAEPLMLAGGRRPGRPLDHVADLGDARPDERLLTHRDAVADRFAAGLHEIEEARVGIDNDRAGRLLAMIVDDMTPIRLRNDRLLVRRPREQVLVAL